MVHCKAAVDMSVRTLADMYADFFVSVTDIRLVFQDVMSGVEKYGQNSARGSRVANVRTSASDIFTEWFKKEWGSVLEEDICFDLRYPYKLRCLFVDQLYILQPSQKEFKTQHKAFLTLHPPMYCLQVAHCLTLVMLPDEEGSSTCCWSYPVQ